MSNITKDSLSKVIQKTSTILGPQVSLMRAREIPGLELSASGEILKITGDKETIYNSLIESYSALSGKYVRAVLRSLDTSQDNKSTK